MKYCTKCGYQLADEMLFCPKCGTKSELIQAKQVLFPVNTPNTVSVSQQPFNSSTEWDQSAQNNRKSKIRAGMKAGMIICFVFTGLFTLLSIGAPSIMAMSLLFAVLGLMFLFLGLTPKASKHMYFFNKPCKLKKSLFVLSCIIGAFIVFVIIMTNKSAARTFEQPQNAQIGSSSSQEKTETEQNIQPSTEEPIDQQPIIEEPENVIILDVEKYGNISGSELVALLGEPDEISESTCQGAFDIPCIYYEYSNADVLGEVSFVLVNNQVVRLTSYSKYPYEGKKNVLEQFGVVKSEECVLAADTDVALRYRCPSTKVDDFWINLIEDDTFGFLQITYDMEYYEEWYLPLTSEEQVKYKTDTELTMKSLLRSPKTADFPWLDWQYGKNLFYIAVSSYVDAQNAFGAEVRSTFTFVYSRTSGRLVLAIVDDEVVANDGYIEVNELIQELYDEMKETTVEN